MKRSICILLFSIAILLIFSITILYILFSLQIILDTIADRSHSDMDQIAYDITTETLEPIDYQKIIKNQARLIPAHITLVDGAGNLLADSHRQEAIPGKFFNATIAEAKESGYAETINRDFDRKTITIATAKKYETASVELILLLVYSVENFQKLMTTFILFLSGLAVIIIYLVLIIVLYILHSYKKPINTLLMSTQEVSFGGFQKITIDKGNPELTQLVDKFNSLVDTYELLIESDNKKYSTINSLLSSIQTGILMVDTKNQVTLINPLAEQLLHIDKQQLFLNSHISRKALDKHVLFNEILEKTQQVLENLEVVESFTLTTEEGLVISIDVEIMFSKYQPYDLCGTLVILRDITEFQRLQNLKDEFISNVSHELRTPLTVINGFVETLQAWELLTDEERNTALNIIEVETDRLKKLLSELLLLSKIEGNMDTSHKQDIQPELALQEVLHVLDPIRKEKHITLQYSAPEMNETLFGVSGWFRQILYNLYDNALKYTPNRGSIILSLNKVEDKLVFQVQDSGPGIPDSEKERIFERFYRVDKSRNSKISGSGLGLAITKHMVMEFKGSISVQDAIPQGAIFIVTIPLIK